jgi:hypothetical protein
MGQFEKLLVKILCGIKDKDINFEELCKVLKKMGFEERIKGSHHIFYKDCIEEILNLQPDGAKAKPYQVKQVRGVILKYKLGGNIDV